MLVGAASRQHRQGAGGRRGERICGSISDACNQGEGLREHHGFGMGRMGGRGHQLGPRFAPGLANQNKDQAIL